MLLPFTLPVVEKPHLKPELLFGGVRGWCCEGLGAAGLGVFPEVAWAHWFSQVFPTSQHRELVHSLAMLSVLRRRIPLVGQQRAASELAQHLGSLS